MQVGAYLLFSAALLAVLTGLFLLNILYKKKIKKLRPKTGKGKKKTEKISRPAQPRLR